MRYEDLEPAYNLCKRHTLVLLPVLHGFFGVNEDHKVLVLALEMDLGLGSYAAHIGCSGCVKACEFWNKG